MSDPFVLDVGKVLAVAGVRHTHTLTGSLPGVELPSARVPSGAEVEVDVVVEAQGNDVIADGAIRAPWVGECRRCLEATSGEVEVPFREVYSKDPVEGETFPLGDQKLDLRPMLRETLTLALPLAPLCRDDCPGPDPGGHPVAVPGDSGDTPAEAEGEVSDEAGSAMADDRWAALDQLDL